MVTGTRHWPLSSASQRAHSNAKVASLSLLCFIIMTGERDDVFLEVSIGGEKRGLLEVHLFDHEAPRTTRNFRCLCTGEKKTKV